MPTTGMEDIKFTSYRISKLNLLQLWSVPTIIVKRHLNKVGYIIFQE
jgi:hypothetical protein